MRYFFATLVLLTASIITLAQAPTISDVDHTPVLAAGITISWTTSAPATARVFYDTVSRPSDTDGSQYVFSSAFDATADVSHHFRVLEYLTPSTTYFYKLRSSNGGGITFSAELSFTTAANGIRNSHLLILRVNFPNDLTAGPSDATINSQMSGVADAMAEQSFGQSTVTWEIVPGTHTMPNDTNFYKALESTSQTRRAEQLALDASAIAAGESFDTNDYDQYVICVPQLYDWANAAYVTGVNGRSQMHLNIFSMSYLVWANLVITGLGAADRANAWITNDATVFGSAGAPHSGGIAHPYEALGSSEDQTVPLNIKHKSGTGWLLPANIPVIQYNGVYRIYAHDTETTLVADRTYGIRMPGKDGIQYWIEFRQGQPANGVLIDWGGLMFLDMVPGGSLNDGALTVGNTFTDPDGRSVTFVSTGGTTPSFVDLAIGGLADAPGGKGMKGKGTVRGKVRIR